MKQIILGMKGRLFRIGAGILLFAAAAIVGRLGLEILSAVLFAVTLAVSGYDVFISAVKGLFRRDLLDEKFLMSIASIGAMIIGEWSEGAAVMLFFLVGETFENISVRRSRTSIRALMEICPDEASVLIGDKEETVDAEDVEVGSVIVVRPRERVPLDSVVLSGSADTDTSALTGESLPRAVTVGDTVQSGTVIINGLLTMKTLRESGESAAARILSLVENAVDNKSKEEKFITKFSRIYTPAVVIAALIIAIALPVFKITTLTESVYRALIFLVISCPCALVISVPMAFFGGIGGAASRGILFKGGGCFERVAKADTVALDKTGTLTKGSFRVSEVTALGLDREELFYLAASAEYISNHPLSDAIRGLSDRAAAPSEGEEIAGEGVIATVDSRRVAVGNAALMQRVCATVPTPKGGEVFVAVDGVLSGIITLSDEVKPEAKAALEAMKSLGVSRSVMLSGDRRENAEAVAHELKVGAAYSELSPEDKYARLEELISESAGGVYYVGDGINDAPSLARADVGIAMGSVGQDSAIEAADLVIMSDNLMRIPEARVIARRTLSIAKQNIVFALAVKLLVMLLGALGLANMWLAVFADVGVAILAILNSMRTLLIARNSPKIIEKVNKA